MDKTKIGLQKNKKLFYNITILYFYYLIFHVKIVFFPKTH